MLVVADASPINALIRAGHVDLLGRLFDQIIIPPAVADELTHPHTPPAVSRWVQSPPSWFTVRAPAEIDRGGSKDRGEREAINLAVELSADLLLIDDRQGRAEASRRGLRCVGTLGVLDKAAEARLIKLGGAIDALPADYRKTLDPGLIEQVLREARQRAKPDRQ